LLGTVEPPPATPVVKEVIPGEVVMGVVEVVVPPSTNPEELDVADCGPVAVPAIVPVHDAPEGQHATFPASSRAQLAFCGQHIDSAPRLEHEL
jgi:hypothetical protein